MKLAKVRIENFRHLGTSEDPFELDFTDVLGRVRDFTLLVGPNTCGKTTILDAIAAALGQAVAMPTLRSDFKLSPRTVVRRGALQAKVTCWLRFSSDEIAATREIFRLAEIKREVPDVSEVVLTWTYPDTRKPSSVSSTAYTYTMPSSGGFIAPLSGYAISGQAVAISTFPSMQLSPVEFGTIESDPEQGWLLPRGREQAVRLMATGRADWNSLHRVGGVFTFDQERTGLGKTVSRQVWNIIQGASKAAEANEELRTTDPRSILIDLALQSLVPSLDSRGKVSDEFRLIQDSYARICAPRRIVGAVRDELGQIDIRFHDGKSEYFYDGLSSGEKNVLLLLIRFAAERIHQSIVLIDELELNQHPLWQRKLVHLLPKMGEGNQIIATTHSPYLRDALSPDSVKELGELDAAGKSGGME